MSNIFSRTFPDLGLLIIRVGIGALMIKHGWPKIIGGVEKWESLGSTMSVIGITFLPVFWGLCAALAETLGGLLMALGLFFRPAVFTILFTMFIAIIVNLERGGSFSDWAEPAEVGVTCLGLLFSGPGRYALRPR